MQSFQSRSSSIFKMGAATNETYLLKVHTTVFPTQEEKELE